MNDSQIKDSLIALLAGINRSDGAAITREMTQLDEALADARTDLHPQLRHFLQRRSYAKALDFLGGVPVGHGPSFEPDAAAKS